VTRRIGLARGETFASLLVRLDALFPNSNNQGTRDLVWIDGDGDNITASSDAELGEALAFFEATSAAAGRATPLARFSFAPSRVSFAPSRVSATAQASTSTSTASTATPPAPVMAPAQTQASTPTSTASTATPPAPVTAPAQTQASLPAAAPQVQKAEAAARRERRRAGLVLARAQRSAIQMSRRSVRQLEEQLRRARAEHATTVASFYEAGDFSAVVEAVQGRAYAFEQAVDGQHQTFVFHPSGRLTSEGDEGRWFAVSDSLLAVRVPGSTRGLTLAAISDDRSSLEFSLNFAGEVKMVIASRVEGYVPDPEPPVSDPDAKDGPAPDFDLCPPDAPSKIIRVRVPEGLGSLVESADLLTPEGLVKAAGSVFGGCRRPRGPRGRGGRCGWRQGCCPPFVHLGVTCDASEMSPIVGTRYHKIGQDYDLCEEEFGKLSENDRRAFEVIFTRGSQPVPYGSPVHFGVECDISGQNPIVGNRYHKIGENYDLCEAEFNKLSPEDKLKYEVIAHRGATPQPPADPAAKPSPAESLPEAPDSDGASSAELEKEWVAVDGQQKDGEPKWAKELKFLAELGFTSCEEHLAELLELNGGDCNAVINKLME